MMKRPKKTIFVLVLLGLLAGFAPRSVVASGGLRTVALTGQAAPGTDAEFSYVSGLVLGDNGVLALKAWLDGTGVDSTNDRGIWNDRDGSGFELIAREGDMTPGLGENVNFRSLWFPNSNDVGKIAFSASFVGASIHGGNDSAIWKEDDSDQLALIVREGDIALGAGENVKFGSLYAATPHWTSNTQTVFGALLKGPGIDFSNRYSYWRDDNNGLSLIAREGGLVPGISESFTISDLQELRVTNNGNLAFLVSYTTNSPVPADRNGIWGDIGASGPSLAINSGDTAPGTSAFFSSFRDLLLNNAGQLAFQVR